jgi:uncharacterized membrane protein
MQALTLVAYPLFVLAFSTGWAGGAGAQSAPEPGLTYRVVGVAQNDKLNIRDQAGTAGSIIGTLAPNAGGVVVTGLRQRVGDSVWWQVAHTGARGWVNARFLELENLGAQPKSGFGLRCAGTEPFWSLEIAKGQANFAQPDSETHWSAGPWREAFGLPPGYRFGIDLAAEGKGKPVWAAVSRAEDYCSDGMSDFEHPYSVILSASDGQVYAGCCARAP